MNSDSSEHPRSETRLEQRVDALMKQMTLMEKLGQMNQVNGAEGTITDQLRESISAGHVGSVINEVDLDTVNELQRLAVEESRLGIPLLIGRDVIHGFKTILPIPLGQAATWNPQLVEAGARIAAREAAASGINWTFAPMIDVSRDPRWGRIAESPGEDPYLTGVMATAMIKGFQGKELTAKDAIAACAKHFCGYGAVESGRDYATTNVPENELRNVHMPPFQAAVGAGVVTFMTSFCDIDGVPATASQFLNRQVLRDEWRFDGFVVSDWDSVRLLSIHGLTENDAAAALEAVHGGVDMEMAGEAYIHNLPAMVEEGKVDIAIIDVMVANILRAKFRLGLFENYHTDASQFPGHGDQQALDTARITALQSVVMLKNDDSALPLSVETLNTIAVIGPLAHSPYEQLGTWVFDGDVSLSVTPLDAIRNLVKGKAQIKHIKALDTSRSHNTVQFEAAALSAASADVVIMFLGEESILSGEAHSRADINLPGAQVELVHRVRATGTPVIAVVMAGRPLTLTNMIDDVDAILYAWHPGTMGGPAIADLLFGNESPSGKLPITFPRMVGQIPIYYCQKNTGKPPTPETVIYIDEIDPQAPQTSFGMTAYHLDAGYLPLFVFGYGLSYASFEYHDIRTSTTHIMPGATINISAELTNTSDVAADEVAQLYIRDLVGNVTRPVKELKRFQRLHVAPGQCITVCFELHTDDLSFYGRNMQRMTEPGKFHVWIGGNSDTELRTEFYIVDPL